MDEDNYCVNFLDDLHQLQKKPSQKVKKQHHLNKSFSDGNLYNFLIK